jgi:signal transduction histidine kinase/ligand-binding sensor domain-containing protein
MNRGIFLNVVLLFYLCANSLWAIGPIEFDHISRKEGLPSNSVTAIVQDQYGTMWFGTQNGLIRFDGYNYKFYTNSPTDTNSIAENSIRSLTLTHNGKLLITLASWGFIELDLKTDKFTQIKLKDPNLETAGLQIITMHVDKDGDYWIGTNHGLAKYDPIKKEFHFFSVSSLTHQSVQKGIISSIIDDGKNFLLLYVSGYKVVKLNRFTGESSIFYELEGTRETEFTINKGGILFLDPKGFLWMGTEFKGLYKIESASGKTTSYNVENHFLGSNIIMDIQKDSKGRLWVATDGGGLFEYQYRTDSFQNYQYDPLDISSLSSNAIYCIYEDKQKNVWLGNYATGLNIIMQNKRKFEVYNNQGLEGRKLNNKSVLSIAEGGRGRVLIGTDGGGLNSFDTRTHHFNYYTQDNSGICSNIVKSLLKDSEGNIWIGTYAGGICRGKLSPEGAFLASPIRSLDSSGIRHLNVWSMCEDQKKQIWIGLLEAGIDCFVAPSNRFVAYPYVDDQANGLPSGNIMALITDKKNNVWVGTGGGGLCLFHPGSKSFSSLRNNANDPNSLISNDVLTLFEDSDGHLWIGTKKGGLSLLLDVRTKQFKNYGSKEGLECNNVYGILEDGKKNLWMSTDNGIFRFDRRKNSFHRFTLEDGLQSLEYNSNACFKDSSGFLYFGGPEGFNRFHPDKIWINRSVPNVYISHIKILNHDVEPDISYHDKVYFHKPTHLLDTLELDYTDQALTLEFVCTNYVNRFNNKFSYRLVGFTTEWDTVSANKRFATYTNLAPGNYVFQVRASNNDGVWNVKGKKLVIIVHPPWWMTWWFRTILILSSLLLLIVLYYGRVKQINKKNRTLSTLVKYRTRELQQVNESLKERNEEIMQMNSHVMEQQNEIIKQKESLEESNLALNESNATKDKFFSIVAHDLRNPVSALSALTEMLQNNYGVLNEDDRSQIVSHIQTSASSLKYLVNNLLDWALIQSKHLKVTPTSVNIHKSVEECFKVLKNQAHDKEIHLENRCDAQHFALVDDNMLKTIIRNLVSNSIKFSRKHGIVTLHTQQVTPTKVMISVSDTGIGMTEEKLEMLMSKGKMASSSGTYNEKGTGIGMVIIKEFIEANHGQLEVTSKLEVGTEFNITFPMAIPSAPLLAEKPNTRVL